MRLEGLHHITAITADARQNLAFYSGVLGLRLVKKTINQDSPSIRRDAKGGVFLNQDDPTVYHLFYADEHGSPGADITFFEYPRAGRGHAGAGMVHRIVWRVADEHALDFWERRLRRESIAVAREAGRLRFDDPEGLGIELAVVETAEPPLVAEHPEVPAESALRGFDGVHVYTRDPPRSSRFLAEGMGFSADGDGSWRSQGDERSSFYRYERTEAPGAGGAGTVHHVAWASRMDGHEAWRARVEAEGARPTPVIDRFWFRSIYFREPSGVLFEIASIGPGFDVDEPLERLGEALTLPPAFEHLRPRLERILTPLPDVRSLRGRL